MRFSDDFLDELRFKNDIQSVVTPYVSLISRGNIMVGLCPFHNEKTPSFTVYIDTNSYYCFGCGAGGDSITFIKTAENLDYLEAIKYLAERSGMALPVDAYDDSLGKMRRKMYEMNREAAKFFYQTFLSNEGKAAQDYVLNRGMTPDICKKFGLGYAPDKWDSLIRHLKSKGYREDEMIAASLARKSKLDSAIDVFRHRLMFPVIDLRGNVIAFTGRIFDDSNKNAPKYMNSPESLIYKKSQVLYGLNLAKNNNNRKLILCEGNMDVIALHQAGFTNAIAAMGTSFTQGHAKLISNYADEVILAYDSDEAGQKASMKVISILESTQVKTKVVKMVGGKDPDDIIRAHGKERMRDILSGAVNDTEFRLLSAAEGIDMQTPDGKLSFLNKAAEIIASLRNPMEKDIYIRKISSDLDVSSDAIETMVKKISQGRKRYKERTLFTDVQKRIAGQTNIVGAEKAYNAKTKAAEETLIRSILQNPDFAKKIENLISPDIFFSETHKKIYYIISEKIKNNQKIDLIYFADDLTNEEMSVLTRLINEKTILSNTINECQDCINALKSEKEKMDKPNLDEISDEDFLSLFKKDSD